MTKGNTCRLSRGTWRWSLYLRQRNWTSYCCFIVIPLITEWEPLGRQIGLVDNREIRSTCWKIVIGCMTRECPRTIVGGISLTTEILPNIIDYEISSVEHKWCSSWEIIGRMSIETVASTHCSSECRTGSCSCSSPSRNGKSLCWGSRLECIPLGKCSRWNKSTFSCRCCDSFTLWIHGNIHWSTTIDSPSFSRRIDSKESSDSGDGSYSGEQKYLF